MSLNAFSKPAPASKTMVRPPRVGGKVLHLDMDSFFATVEQQARPHLRGRAIGLSIADSPGGTVIGSSIEAKRRGVGTASRLSDARMLIPGFIVLSPNPGRYRTVHKRVRALMREYSPEVQPRSIDEIALWLSPDQLRERPVVAIAAEIKRRIREEIGDWLSSSIGIGPNWWLAKTACGMRKPDGLLEMTADNTRRLLGELQLTDLCGIARRMAARFQLAGIPDPVTMYDTPAWELKRRFGIVGYYWYRRLHGQHIDTEDRPTRTIGHSSVIPRPTASARALKPLLGKLSERTARRLRKAGYLAQSIGAYASYRDAPGGWGGQVKVRPFGDSGTLLGETWRMLDAASLRAPVRLLAVRVSHLVSVDPEQLELWPYATKRRRATRAVDAINDRWGELIVHPAGMLGTEHIAKDSIAFGQDMKHPDEPIPPRGL